MRKFWFNEGMAFLPIFLVIWTYLTFTVSYIFAVSRGDIDPGFPFISDTGARRPESSLFGQMLNISAVVAFACLYIRYKQITGYLDQLADTKFVLVNRLNNISFVFAFIICLGVSLVANFQETSVLTVHLIGALMAFGVGTVYECIQTYISYKMHPEVNGKFICHSRLAISLVSVAALAGELIASAFTTSVDENSAVKFHWKPDDPGYAGHLASTILEWILAGSFLAFFYTFIRDFQKITLEPNMHLHQDTLYHDQREQLRDEIADGDYEA